MLGSPSGNTGYANCPTIDHGEVVHIHPPELLFFNVVTTNNQYMRTLVIGTNMLGCALLQLMARSTDPGIIMVDPGHEGEPIELERGISINLERGVVSSQPFILQSYDTCEIPNMIYDIPYLEWKHPPRNGVYKNKFKPTPHVKPRHMSKARSNC